MALSFCSARGACDSVKEALAARMCQELAEAKTREQMEPINTVLQTLPFESNEMWQVMKNDAVKKLEQVKVEHDTSTLLSAIQRFMDGGALFEPEWESAELAEGEEVEEALRNAMQHGLDAVRDGRAEGLSFLRLGKDINEVQRLSALLRTVSVSGRMAE